MIYISNLFSKQYSMLYVKMQILSLYDGTLITSGIIGYFMSRDKTRIFNLVNSSLIMV